MVSKKTSMFSMNFLYIFVTSEYNWASRALIKSALSSSFKKKSSYLKFFAWNLISWFISGYVRVCVIKGDLQHTSLYTTALLIKHLLLSCLPPPPFPPLGLSIYCCFRLMNMWACGKICWHQTYFLFYIHEKPFKVKQRLLSSVGPTK